MKSDEIDIFDELVRGKLSNYSEAPEPEWIHSIQAKKGRAVNLYQLYRLMLIAVIVGAGIFAGIQLLPYQSVQYNTSIKQETGTTSKIDNTRVSTTPRFTVEFASSDISDVIVTETNNSSDANASIDNTSEQRTAIHKNTKATSTNAHNKASASNNRSKKDGINKQQNKAQRKQTSGIPIHNQTKQTQTPDKTLLKETEEKLIESPAENPEDKNENKPEASNTPCKAAFDYYTSYTGEFNFTHTSAIAANANMIWDFGDGNTAENKTAAHAYKASGEYDVTLTITNDKTSCSFSKHITYQNPNEKAGPISISGSLVAGSTIVKNGIVELYVFDEQKGRYKSYQTIRTNQSGEYTIMLDRKIKYLLKGYPTADTKNYAATFWGNTSESESATEIMIMPSETDNLIGYKIDLLAQEHEDLPPLAQNTGNPNDGKQQVFLVDEHNNIISVGTVDPHGNYNFDGDIAGGDYNIVNPVTGSSSSTKIEPGTSNVSGNMSGNKGGTDNKVSVYPNPANEVINFNVNSKKDETAILVIMDASGVEKARKQVSLSAGLNQSQYDLTYFAPGVYYIMILRNGQEVLSNRIVKLADDK
jgi:PKD repeat protein